MEGEGKDLRFIGILCARLKLGQVSKSRVKIALLKVMQRKCLLRSKRYKSGMMLNLNGQVSSRACVSSG